MTRNDWGVVIMASKSYRKKQRVRELKQERQKYASGVQKKQKYGRIVIYALAILVIAGLIYLMVASAMRPAYIPGSGNSPSTGPQDAPVTFVEFGCFTCPFTKSFNLEVLPVLMEEYEGRVNFVFRNVPIYSNPGAELAAIASRCADDQGRFWEYADTLFAATDYTEASLRNYAQTHGLNMDEFDACLDSRMHRDAVREDAAEGRRARIGITPTVFVNGVRIDGAHDISLYRRLLNDMLSDAEAQQ